MSANVLDFRRLQLPEISHETIIKYRYGMIFLKMSHFHHEKVGLLSLKSLLIGNTETKERDSLIYVKRLKISQKVSTIPICRLEWGSQDPPLFTGLLQAVAH